MPAPILTLTLSGLGLGLWFTRRWGRSPWRWLIWPQAALMLWATQLAHAGRLPAALLAWPDIDKVLHFLLWGLAAFWLELWLGGRRVAVGRWRLPAALLAPLLLATADEAAQGFSPMRSLDLGDGLCNAAGILLCWSLARRLTRRPTIGKAAAHGAD